MTTEERLERLEGQIASGRRRTRWITVVLVVCMVAMSVWLSVEAVKVAGAEAATDELSSTMFELELAIAKLDRGTGGVDTSELEWSIDKVKAAVSEIQEKVDELESQMEYLERRGLVR